MNILNSNWVLDVTDIKDHDLCEKKFKEIENLLKELFTEMFFANKRKRVTKIKDVEDLQQIIKAWIERSVLIEKYCEGNKDVKFYSDFIVNILEGNGTLDYDDDSGYMFIVRKGEELDSFVNEALDSLI